MKTCRLTSIRLGLSRSTLIDLAFPSKIENASTRTEVNSDRTDSNFNFIFSLFASNNFKENALKSVSNRKCNTYDIGVDGRKRSKCIKLNRWKNDDKKYHGLVSCSMRMYSVQLRSQRVILLVFECSGVDSRGKRIKTVVWSRIDRCVFDDNKNAYLWNWLVLTGP